MEKVIEEMGKLLWRRRIFYLFLTLFLSLMVAFTDTGIIKGNLFLVSSMVFLFLFTVLSYILRFSIFKKTLNMSLVKQGSMDFIMFLSAGWMVGTVTFYHLVSTNSLTLSYLIAVICGIIGGGIPYFIHWTCSPYYSVMENTPLNDEQFKQKDKIAQIVIYANMWEYLAVGIIPFVIAIIKC